MSYIVKGVGATVLLSNGGRVLLYQGEPVPASADADDVARLVAELFLEKVEAPAKAPAKAPDGAPAGNAGLEKWTEYAEGLGLEVPDGASRDDVKALVAASKE